MSLDAVNSRLLLLVASLLLFAGFLGIDKFPSTPWPFFTSAFLPSDPSFLGLSQTSYLCISGPVEACCPVVFVQVCIFFPQVQSRKKKLGMGSCSLAWYLGRAKV